MPGNNLSVRLSGSISCQQFAAIYQFASDVSMAIILFAAELSYPFQVLERGHLFFVPRRIPKFSPLGQNFGILRGAFLRSDTSGSVWAKLM